MNINELKQRLKSAQILVVGDVMLDRYWFGSADRISPEAPVPVVRVDKTEYRLGGAGNVALNIAKQGAQVKLLSVRGDDQEGRELEALLERNHIESHLLLDKKLSTTIKTRVIAQRQQLVRIDFESTPTHEVLNQTLKRYADLVLDADVIVFSDYGKGGLQHIAKMIREANKADKCVLVDPKGVDFEKYYGASYITPNKTELRNVVGSWQSEEELTQKVNTLLEDLRLKGLLLTRSEEGMSLFRGDRSLSFPTSAQEIYDVSGAGDTVIGILAAMLASGCDIEESVAFANRAAGIVVGKLGTATVNFDELFPEGEY
ncbi:MAG: D-glycero-beta-D-manno-heptose-7-phosphate kinase [Proteobacteria bacterium]|nr:D-glycero-beta-D-manno-heptose-7-phosphate kinase [Pseudomonadota bacterium]MDA1332466.1 D-glycero-beta-D-manno-heptose-7-phosphate kinase [Pseudomonadota bacterium]